MSKANFFVKLFFIVICLLGCSKNNIVIMPYKYDKSEERMSFLKIEISPKTILLKKGLAKILIDGKQVVLPKNYSNDSDYEIFQLPIGGKKNIQIEILIYNRKMVYEIDCDKYKYLDINFYKEGNEYNLFKISYLNDQDVAEKI